MATKFEPRTKDLENMELEKLRSVFPECFAEDKLNIDKLLTIVGEHCLDDFEKYEFRWKGKSEALLVAQQRSMATLRPCVEESVNWDETKNLYIEGDNLEVMRLLQKSYHRQVKLIYIDPPYNTGHDFVYRDDWTDSLGNYKRITEQGMRSNTETGGRYHTEWLNMMYPRLRMAKHLLRDDGVMFISIDDNEVHNLRKLCDEVFGEECFVADISWQRTYSSRNDSLGVVVEVEHILAYSRQPDWSPNKLPRTKEMDAKYSSPDGDDRLWTSSSISAPGAVTHQGMVYAIQHPFSGEMIYPTTGRCWTLGQDQMLENMRQWCDYELRNINDVKKRADVCGITEDAIRQDVKAIVLSNTLEVSRRNAQSVLDRGKWPYFYFTDGGKGGIRRKTYLDDMGGRLPTNFWPFSEVGHTDEAKKEVKALFDGDIPFDTPKPVRLLERILTISTDIDSIVLDFFSGSATTAHAVMKKNAEDGGCRRFIMVQLPEASTSSDYRTLCDIGRERIRRAGAKILEEQSNKQMDLSSIDTEDRPLDIGFRVFKLDTSNIKTWDTTPINNPTPEQIDMLSQRLNDMIDCVKPDRTDLDMVYEVLIKLGNDLCESVTPIEIDGVTAYAMRDDCLFMVCLDKGVTVEIAEQLAEYAPGLIVFGDKCFEDTTTLANVDLALKDMGIDIQII